MPGLVNAHTHGHANLMKGVAEAWTLEASLTNGPWLAGTRDPETMYLSTLLGAIDMLSKGCTACFDLVYEFPRPTKARLWRRRTSLRRCRHAGGARADGRRQNLFQSIPGLIEALPRELATLLGFRARPAERDRLLRSTIVTARDDMPDGITSLSRRPFRITARSASCATALISPTAIRFQIHMHIAESRLQAIVARKIYGRSAVRYSADFGALRPGFTAAHGVWLDDDDLDLLAAHGCSVAHIPASNYRLGSGVAQVRPMLDRGINVGLATDGANSSDSLSMLQAMRLASFGARIFVARARSG